ncbi:DegT/DnrJ/EryC1/StrS family aminotransferase [Candidatus Woesearchaeota archaeon]|nr:DegT/DnrJ/EryC1/StrS family aminotransferase [Candidatus Woesearchaeota archaeon]
MEASDIKKDHTKSLNLLSGLTGHKHVKLVHRGNAAILCALFITKKINPKPFVLIPDQGGWISFKTYPKMLGFDIRTVKTNRGVIDLIDLEKKAESGAAFIVTSFAGYFAEQPMKYISTICRRYGCLLIEDASGALGDAELCDGDYSDIIVGSFGKWKPINIEYGGFISVGKKEYFTEANEIFSTTNHYPEYSQLLSKLGSAKQNLLKMVDRAEKVKQELSNKFPDLKIIHRDLRGVNVIIRYLNNSEKDMVKAYCENNKFEFVECPNYIRLDEDAISIELKRNEIVEKRGDVNSS